MARAEKEEIPEFDRDVWEYLTYAPGRTCSACSRKVKPLEPVRRRVEDRTSGAPVIVYRHNKCPSARAVAA
ncbi:hypothetical protein GCM10010371_15460 [Streptomyces subrutilus]|uniref:Uncharacterized protein n=1 Tax=Streptomyces subrutilus TaxID=36818 RepID=A0A5P2UFJ7_9ACTN|nr:hypothetical protein CP968_06735 [Streptomyces subrutilus]GGZ56819.1 hypothetical protein GCM10010371_15460 [Streptomyces subrutilus]